MSGLPRTRERWVPALLLAVVVTVLALVGIWRFGIGQLLRPPPVPVQALAFERVELDPDRITVSVRNAGPDPIDIAQVLIDEAYWRFDVAPDAHLGRLDTARIRLAYPWIEGDPLTITVIDSVGVTFAHEIEVAARTPRTSSRTIVGYVVLGTYAGVIPVFLGLLFLPALRRVGPRTWRFLLGVTAGLLIFLALDASAEALEIGARIAAPFQGTALVFGGAGVSFAVLQLVARRLGRGGSPTELAIAYLIAIGIGLHNMGEGLAIGSAQALGEIALGSFLVMGFALHNLTEGIGIVAPTAHKPPRFMHLVALGAIAGFPTIGGTIAGGLAYSPVPAVFLLSVGVGAIIQVVYELGRLVRRDGSGLGGPWIVGTLAGFALMYLTAILIKS